MSEPARDERDQRKFRYVHIHCDGPQFALKDQGFGDDVRGLSEDEEHFGIELVPECRLAVVEAERDALENQLYTEQHERDTVAERRVQELERMRDLATVEMSGAAADLAALAERVQELEGERDELIKDRDGWEEAVNNPPHDVGRDRVEKRAEAAERRVQELEAENEKLKRTVLSEAYTDEGVEVVLNDLRATKQRVQELESREQVVVELARVFIDGDQWHADGSEYRLVNLLEALKVVPDTGDWYQEVRSLFQRLHDALPERKDLRPNKSSDDQAAFIAARSGLSEPSSSEANRIA